MSLTQTIRVNKLIDLYGKLLTSKQYNVVYEYFCLNNSLSEISENYAISRQAVNYTIKQVLDILESYESKLQLLAKYDKVNSVVNTIVKSGDVSLVTTITDILED